MTFRDLRLGLVGRPAIVSAALGLSFGAAKADILTVVPTQFTSTEGSTSSSSLFQTGAASLQAFYSQAFLSAAGITPGAVINGIAYRRSGGGTTGPAGDTTFASYNIFMSQSFATPGELTNTFANNVIGGQTQVHSGSRTFLANSFSGGATPNAFGPVVDFSTGYTYTGGSLLIEFRRSARTGSTTSINTDVDGTVATQAGARWLFNTTSDSAVTGTLSNGAHIFQLRYNPVPEPASIAALGLGAAALLRRRKRR